MPRGYPKEEPSLKDGYWNEYVEDTEQEQYCMHCHWPEIQPSFMDPDHVDLFDAFFDHGEGATKSI